MISKLKQNLHLSDAVCLREFASLCIRTSFLVLNTHIPSYLTVQFFLVIYTKQILFALVIMKYFFNKLTIFYFVKCELPVFISFHTSIFYTQTTVISLVKAVCCLALIGEISITFNGMELSPKMYSEAITSEGNLFGVC